ncbi:hypothetical protein JTB14_019553 [Gonioctena quinquepunctata]|nr:hypothetical protein JTB14_019553 [Gonioctena quinquepunctata]
MKDDDSVFEIEGEEPYENIPEDLFGKIIYDSLASSDMNQIAMVDASTHRSIAYGEILEETRNLAKALHRYGTGPDSIHAICSENSLEFFIPVIACFYLGCTVAPWNHLYTMNELCYQLDLTKPNLIFCSQAVKDRLIECNRKFIEKIIIIDSTSSSLGTESLQYFIASQLRSTLIASHVFQPFNEGDPSQHVALILSSSGTTGMPKGVMITHRNLQVRLLQSRDPRLRSATSDRINLGLVPFFHAIGMNLGLTALINEEKLVILQRFEKHSFLRAIQDHWVTLIPLVPPLVIFLAKTPLLDRYDISYVNEIYCGGAPLDKDIEISFIERFNHRITQMYGMTEATLAVTISRPHDKYKPGSCGKVISFMSLKVVDPDSGKSLEHNKLGEIYMKGPMVMKGYFKNEGATRNAITPEGWLKSGDLGYYDEEENFFVVDRLKELIKFNGYQVAPAELEALLINHPKVLDAGVVGLPDDSAGELPLAFVVKRPGMEVKEKELQDFVFENLSPQKSLRGGVIFVPAIPKNPSGKILRRELRKALENFDSECNEGLSS